MNKYLYVDNYRGFTDSLLPIKDVNFFVGENSTGKSSILSLIKLLEDTQNFWTSTNPQFTSKDIGLGNFKDIVNIHSKNPKYFRVGVMEFSENNKRETCFSFLITFREKEGMPAVNRYTFRSSDKQLDIKFEMDEILYSYQKPIQIKDYSFNGIKDVFEKLSDSHEFPIKNYQKLPKKMVFTSLAGLNTLLFVAIGKEEDIGKRIARMGFISLFGGRVKWIAPIRSKPRRIYELFSVEYSPEGEHTPYMVKKFYGKDYDKAKFKLFINEFGDDSGLFNGIEIKDFASGVTSPFELDIKLKDTLFKITDVGYGVSQILPIIVEMFNCKSGECLLIQQPEIHLHPKAQAAFGEMIYKLAIRNNIKFIIETHSDFIIDRFRVISRNTTNEKANISSQIVFFERTKNENKFYTIDVLPDGTLSQEQPKGYREFFLKEDLRVLGY